MANTKKTSLVDSMISILEETSNFVLVKFHKTKHTTLEKLRRELKKNNASISVVKNTLFEKALNKLDSKDIDVEDLKKQALPLKDNSAFLALKGDWIKGLKAMYEFMKKEESITFKVGQIDKTVYDSATLVKLAQLPGKDQLIAKVIGSMKSPMARTTRALKFNMQKLVYVLSQKSQQTS